MKNIVNFRRPHDKTNKIIGFDVITIDDKYFCEDIFGNRIYVAKTNKQSKVQQLFLSGMIDDCRDISEIREKVCKFFNRKN